MCKLEITTAEWDVMRVIWANQVVKAQDVYDILHEKEQWTLSTVKTLLNRLVKKGYVQTEQDGRSYLYTATQTHEQALSHKLLMQLDGTCQKNKGDILMNVLDQVELSQQQIKELQKLLSQKANTAPEVIACRCIKGQCTCHH